MGLGYSEVGTGLMKDLSAAAKRSFIQSSLRRMRVLYPIVLLGALGVVEAIKVTNEIAGDPPDALKPNALAYKPGFGIGTQMIEICHDIFSF